MIMIFKDESVIFQKIVCIGIVGIAHAKYDDLTSIN